MIGKLLLLKTKKSKLSRMSKNHNNFIKLPSEHLPDLDDVVEVLDRNGKVFKACRVWETL